MPNNTSKSADTAEQLEIRKRREQVMDLRVSGLSMRQVAARVGISVGQVHADIKAALADIPADSVREYREVRGEQLEAIIAAMLPSARTGDADCANAATRAISEFCKLYGLNAKVEVNVSGALQLTATAHDQLLDRLARLATGGAADDDHPEPEPG